MARPSIAYRLSIGNDVIRMLDIHASEGCAVNPNDAAWTNPIRRPADRLEIPVNGRPVIIHPNHCYYLSLCWIRPEYREAAYVAMEAGCIPREVYQFFEKDGKKPKPVKGVDND